MQLTGSYFLDQGLNLDPGSESAPVLTAGLPGNSPSPAHFKPLSGLMLSDPKTLLLGNASQIWGRLYAKDAHQNVIYNDNNLDVPRWGGSLSKL